MREPQSGGHGRIGQPDPKNQTDMVVTVGGQLALVWKKRISFVRMRWMMSVCVVEVSTNQPVWNSAAGAASKQLKTHSTTKKVV